MRALLAVMVLLPGLAQAQQQVEDDRSSYWWNCKQVWTRAPYVSFHPNTLYLPTFSGPAPSSGSSGGSSGGGPSFSGFGSGGGGHPEALLVLAVVVLAVLPFVVYAVDEDADGLTLERFHCPEFNFTAMGGVQLGGGPNQRPTGLGIAKFRADIGYVGAMAEMDMQPSGGGLAPGGSAHFLLRPQPKAHIEGALAIGGRRAIGPGGALDGVELALPHMYVFNRDGYKKLGLEVMPRVFFNRAAIDAGADLTMVIPVADVLQLRVGAGLFSHAGATQFTASAGLNAHL